MINRLTFLFKVNSLKYKTNNTKNLKFSSQCRYYFKNSKQSQKKILSQNKTQSQTFFQYKPYLNNHIYQILNSNPYQYRTLSPYFNQIIQNANCENTIKEKYIKNKFNLIYNATSIRQPSLTKYSSILISFIIKQQIKSQQQLDKTIAFLRNNVKNHYQIAQNQIQQFIRQFSKETQANEQIFHQQLQILVQQQEKQIQKHGHDILGCISKISKKMRQKFVSLNSKYIFQKVSNICKAKSNKLKEKVSKSRQCNQDINFTISRKNNQFWDKIDSIRPRVLEQECNSKKVYEQHLKITGGVKRFRFPPQPNGYLHIGHVKAMRINFETAIKQKGTCFLRYDDTNPETQTHEYIDQIYQNVKWLGYTPDKITYASDYFQQMLFYANELIKKGHAYVCERSPQQMQNQRKNKQESPFRNRSIEQNLKIFPNLQQGQTLRLKGDSSSPNPNLRDPVIYRLKSSLKPHPKTGNKYKIYPIYDFAHCLSDSIQHIDYSLCSLEFEVRRQLYYRYLNLLNLYKPIVWEYSRLNIQGNVLSKRKIKALIQSKVIENWQDPRLLTIGGLKNRGYTPSMLKQFIDKVNSSRSGNQNIVQFNILQRSMKKQLYKKAKKTMAVLEPVNIKINNFNNINQKQLSINQYTEQSQIQSKRKIKISQSIMIQLDDLQKLQKNQYFILKYAGVYQFLSKQNQNNLNLQIKFISKIDQQNKLNQIGLQKKKLKKIHWISKEQSKNVNIFLFQKLLNQRNQINQYSKKQMKNCLIDKNIQEDDQYWQFERLGYFKWNLITQNNRNQMIRCCSL